MLFLEQHHFSVAKEKLRFVPVNQPADKGCSEYSFRGWNKCKEKMVFFFLWL
jgi:hypothetical protein